MSCNSVFEYVSSIHALSLGKTYFIDLSIDCIVESEEQRNCIQYGFTKIRHGNHKKLFKNSF